jgi:hypothetical protein
VLPAAPGYNMGTGALTLTIPLPPAPGTPTPKTTWRATARHVVVWAMLGVLPHLDAVETMFAAELGGAVEESLRTSTPPSLANLCLRTFLQHARVAVTDKKVNFALQAMTLTVVPAEKQLRGARDNVLYTDSGALPFW